MGKSWVSSEFVGRASVYRAETASASRLPLPLAVTRNSQSMDLRRAMVGGSSQGRTEQNYSCTKGGHHPRRGEEQALEGARSRGQPPVSRRREARAVVPLLGKLLPLQVRAKNEDGGPVNLELNPNMSLSEMIDNFERQIKSVCIPFKELAPPVTEQD